MTLDVTEKIHTFSASFSQSMVNIFIKYITETVKEPIIMPHQAPRREIVSELLHSKTVIEVVNFRSSHQQKG